MEIISAQQFKKAVRQELKNHKGKFFSIQFIKKDGTLRDMICREGVKAYLTSKKSRNSITSKFKHVNPTDYLSVWDAQKKAYRTVRIESILRIKIAGTTYTAKEV